MSLFDSNLVYPCDEYGPYIELEGQVIEVGEPLIGGEVGLKVKTDRGQFTAYACGPMAPFAKEAKWALIRVYDSGDGWYPDNQVTSLSRYESPKEDDHEEIRGCDDCPFG